MAVCIAIIAKPCTPDIVRGWALRTEIEAVLDSGPLVNVCPRGNKLLADPITFPDLDCTLVAGAVLYECNNDPHDETRSYDVPLTMPWTQNEDGSLTFHPCFDDGAPAGCVETTEPDYVSYLCEDPCKRWARLEYKLEELVSGMDLAGGQSQGRSKQFNVNLKAQCDKLEKMIARAKLRCIKCNPKLAAKFSSARPLFTKVRTK